MNLDLDDVEQDVVKSLNDLDKRTNSWSDDQCTRTAYTREVKKAVGSVARKHDCTVCSHHHDYTEWLYDLCWRKLDDKGFVRDVPLIMECEWYRAYEDLLDDFQKLLVARADHRIFLCELEPEHWDECVRKLIEQVRCYNGTEIGDRYLFGSWTVPGWDFRQYIVDSGMK